MFGYFFHHQSEHFFVCLLDTEPQVLGRRKIVGYIYGYTLTNYKHSFPTSRLLLMYVPNSVLWYFTDIMLERGCWSNPITNFNFLFSVVGSWFCIHMPFKLENTLLPIPKIATPNQSFLSKPLSLFRTPYPGTWLELRVQTFISEVQTRFRPIMEYKYPTFLYNKLDDTKSIIKQAEHHDDDGYNVVTDIIKHSSRWVS